MSDGENIFMVKYAFALLLLAMLCVGYGYFIEPNRLMIVNDTLTIKNWNRTFDGLKIVMIGDIHGGSNNVTEAKLREIVEKTNAQQPDVVVLLGVGSFQATQDGRLPGRAGRPSSVRIARLGSPTEGDGNPSSP